MHLDNGRIDVLFFRYNRAGELGVVKGLRYNPKTWSNSYVDLLYRMSSNESRTLTPPIVLQNWIHNMWNQSVFNVRARVQAPAQSLSIEWISNSKLHLQLYFPSQSVCQLVATRYRQMRQYRITVAPTTPINHHHLSVSGLTPPPLLATPWISFWAPTPANKVVPWQLGHQHCHITHCCLARQPGPPHLEVHNPPTLSHWHPTRGQLWCHIHDRAAVSSSTALISAITSGIPQMPVNWHMRSCHPWGFWRIEREQRRGKRQEEGGEGEERRDGGEGRGEERKEGRQGWSVSSPLHLNLSPWAHTGQWWGPRRPTALSSLSLVKCTGKGKPAGFTQV